MPNTYARGILFGKMILELGDVSSITNERTGFRSDVDFKTKVRYSEWRRGYRADRQGWISGGYNAIAGSVKGPNGAVGDLTGHWNTSIEYCDKKTGKKEVVFDAGSVKHAPKAILPEEEQEDNESRRSVCQNA